MDNTSTASAELTYNKTDKNDTFEQADDKLSAIAPDESAPSPHSRKFTFRKTCVTIGFLLVVAAWVLMMPKPFISMGCVVVGLILSIIGVRVPAGPRRDFATTAIVAGSVLVLVYALYIGLLAFI